MVENPEKPGFPVPPKPKEPRTKYPWLRSIGKEMPILGGFRTFDRGAIGALTDAGGFAGAAAQIIELGAADLALAHHHHRIHQRRIDREDAFHAFAIGQLAHREGLVQAGALAGDADAFKRLD